MLKMLNIVAFVLALMISLQSSISSANMSTTTSSSSASSSHSLDIIVQYTSGHSCTLTFKGSTMPCSLGSNGVSSDKKEGDGKTPIGTFPLRRIFYRGDKLNPLPTFPDFMPVNKTEVNFGWCDAPTSSVYNQLISTPFSESHENLWLNSSNVYDLLAVVGYNDDPVVPYAGSAIFFHVTETYGSTAGCIALNLEDLKSVLSNLDPETKMQIKA